MCTALIQAAENAAVSSEQQLEQFIDQYCVQFFGNGFGGTICEDAVNALIGPLLNEIVQQLPPQQVCGDVGLCSVGMHKREMVHTKKVSKAKIAKPHEELDICAICEAVVTYAENEVNTGAGDLQNYIDQQCQKTAGFAPICVALINALIPALEALMKQNVSPAFVCGKSGLGLCSSSQVQVKTPVGNGLTQFCGVCKSVVGMAENDVENGDLQKFADNLCNSLGNDYASMCRFAVSMAIPQIKKLLSQQGASPQSVCTDVHLCSASSALVGWTPNQEICDVCMGAAQALVDELNDPSVQKDIEQALLAVCNIIPGSEKQTCTMIIDNYFGQIWSMVMSYLNAKEICTLIKLCS